MRLASLDWRSWTSGGISIPFGEMSQELSANFDQTYQAHITANVDRVTTTRMQRSKVKITRFRK